MYQTIDRMKIYRLIYNSAWIRVSKKKYATILCIEGSEHAVFTNIHWTNTYSHFFSIYFIIKQYISSRSVTVSDGLFMVSATRDVPRSKTIGGEKAKPFFENFKKLSKKTFKFSKLGGVNDF